MTAEQLLFRRKWQIIDIVDSSIYFCEVYEHAIRFLVLRRMLKADGSSGISTQYRAGLRVSQDHFKTFYGTGRGNNYTYKPYIILQLFFVTMSRYYFIPLITTIKVFLFPRYDFLSRSNDFFLFYLYRRLNIINILVA